MKTALLAVAVTATLLAGPALAQEVSDCDWRARADAIAEPWSENTRTFSNGKTRLTLLDTIEPGAASFFLLVMSPPYGETGERQCKVIGLEPGIGFGGIDFGHLEAGYDPAVGLRFSVPAMIYLPEDGFSNPVLLNFTLNQATGTILADMVLGPE